MGHAYYRIVRNAIPAADDFRTAREEGLPLLDNRYLREWDEGISVYDNFEYALKRARDNRTNLGRFVATLVVPEDGSIEVRQTMRPPHHTIYASGQRALALVQGATVPALDEA